MKKIKELQKRSKLCEGRNYGVGFTILNKKGSKFETYLPFTACRDYLNDFAYVESTKKEIGSIYGYNHKLLNCFLKWFNLLIPPPPPTHTSQFTYKPCRLKPFLSNNKQMKLFFLPLIRSYWTGHTFRHYC